MRQPLPIWSVPLLLALVGIVALIGHLSSAVLIVVIGLTLLVCAYAIVLSRRGSSPRTPTSNLLSLFPGHLLVLLIIALLEEPGWLAWGWTIIPVATLAYDWVGRRENLSSRVRMSISIILYGILWADLFLLLERTVVLHRALTGRDEIMIAAGFGLVGALFFALGVYRHRLVAKE